MISAQPVSVAQVECPATVEASSVAEVSTTIVGNSNVGTKHVACVSVNVSKSPMFEVLQHAECQRQPVPSPRLSSSAVSDIASVGRCPLTWTPSREGDDRKGMAAILAHNENPK